ncbi:MAG: hypothetical protein JW863_11585 [Chitinispirillaceae bacterium]|nr:hypothetical protein [Chitinispirillaceae bacterium]
MVSSLRTFAVKTFVAGMCCIIIAGTGSLRAEVAPPEPVGLTPNERQIEWYHREQQAFIHFNMNTFTGNPERRCPLGWQ